jgi:hypothetical protein
MAGSPDSLVLGTKVGQSCTSKVTRISQALLAANNLKSRVIYYAPDLPRWLPDSPSYIGPKRK